jgi:hypothetical protein
MPVQKVVVVVAVNFAVLAAVTSVVVVAAENQKWRWI